MDMTETDMSEAESTAAPSFPPHASPLPPGSLLPPDVEGFIEPIPTMPQLLDWLGQSPDPARTAPLIACLTGGPGTGKTALAVHIAYRLQGAYPDGQLYASLETTPPWEVRRQFLQALGANLRDFDLASAPRLYQSLLSHMRVLIVLDGAESADRVQPLLPDNPSCSVIVTSREPLSGLPEAKIFTLPSENRYVAHQMFRVAFNSSATLVEDATLDQLARRFNTPLAARLALSLIQDGQADPATLLEQTGHDASSIRAVLARAYADLQPTEARLLRLLALLDRSEVEPGLVAALLDSNLTDAASAITSLVQRAFVNVNERGSYIIHQVIRDYAKERLDEEESPESQRAAKARADRWIARRGGWQPKPRIARDYWTVADQLGYGPYAAAIASFIRHDETEPPLTIGIKAQWGAGKSSLMRMVQKRLDAPEDEDTWKARRIRFEEASRAQLGVTTGRQPPKAPRKEQASTVTMLKVFRRANVRSPSEIPDLDRLKLQSPEGVPAEDWRPTVWFNPWMYQSSEQIWAGLGHEIIAQVTGRMETIDRERFWLELNMRRVDKLAVRRKIYKMLVERLLPLGLVFGVAILIALLLLLLASTMPVVGHALKVVSVTLFAGGGTAFLIGAAYRATRFFGEGASGPFAALVRQPDPVQGVRSVLADEAKGAFQELVTDPRYEDRLGFLYLVHTDMKRVLDIIATPDRPLVVFVDDLDRCSPAVVAQVIEAINLFLAGEFQNCIFVLAVEPAVVAANVEVAYKDLVDNLKVDRLQGDWSSLGWRFLEKIVQLPLSLPRPDSKDALVATYVDSLLTAGDTRTMSGTAAGAGAAASQVDGKLPDPRAVAGAYKTTPTPAASAAGDDAEARRAVTQEAAARRDAMFAEQVAELETAIERRAPSIQTLPQMAHEAQREVFGTDEYEPLRAETLEASDRVFARLYSDTDARDAIVAEVQTRLTSGNPREIKRFINLFRFYTFILQRKRISQGSSSEDQVTPTSQEVAKLAALAIRWPYLLNALGASRDDGSSALSYLEEAARDQTQPDNWRRVLEQASLLKHATGDAPTDDPGWVEDLRIFLGGEPRIGDASKLLL
jgi:hypothetical protein